jgi:general nucleoside transport system permease protein
MRWQVEKRSSTPWYLVTGVLLLAVLAALVVTGLIFWMYGTPPWRAYGLIFEALFSDFRSFSEVLRRMIPLLLCGVGLVLAFRAKFWNIGAEGQLLAGAVAASGVALFVPLPAPLVLPAMFVSGFLAGALWGLLPALLKVKLGVNEIITTLMMNYIAFYTVQWLINGPWKGQSMRGFAYTDRFDSAARLPTLMGTRFHYPTLILGVLLAIVVTLLLARSTLGFEIRMMGASPSAARYAGVNFLRTTIVLMLIAGGAAGMAGVGEVAGIHGRLVGPYDVALGYGYTAIIVALLARRNPLGAIVSALFLGFVFAAGDIIKVTLRLPFQITDVISGLVLFFLICSEPLIQYRLKRVRTDASAVSELASHVGTTPETSGAGTGGSSNNVTGNVAGNVTNNIRTSNISAGSKHGT